MAFVNGYSSFGNSKRKIWSQKDLFPDRKAIHEEVITTEPTKDKSKEDNREVPPKEAKEIPKEETKTKEKNKYTKLLKQASILKIGGGLFHKESKK